MSNPGVITLAKSNNNILLKIKDRILFKKNINIKIEDNIGESIHLHLDDIRIDFTINEFENFSSQINFIFKDYLNKISPLLISLPNSFLSQIARNIIYINDVNIINKKISDLNVIENIDLNFGLIRINKIKNSIIVLALCKNKQDFYSYRQNDDRFTDNADRIEKINMSIVKNNYPFNNEYIVVFSNQSNLIRDGQHRASVLYKLNPNATIPVLSLSFSTDLSVKRLNLIYSRMLYLCYYLIKKYKLILSFFKNNLQ